jgi:hypothetical protein
MDDEYWKILAIYGDDQTIAETKWVRKPRAPENYLEMIG